MIEAQKILRGREGDELSCMEKRDARGEKYSFANVVGDEDNGFFEAAGEGAEFALKFGAGDGIEGSEGLVHKKNRRVGGERTCDTDALALAAGKFTRTTGGKFGGIESDKAKQFFHAGRDSRRLPFFESGNEGDVFGDGEMRKKTGFLDDVTNSTAEVDGVVLSRGAAIDKDLTLGRKKQAIDEPEKRRLAAATAAEEDESFAGGDG